MANISYRVGVAGGLVSPTGHPDSTNTGYTKHPSYAGSLTTWPGGGFSASTTYSFYDFIDAPDVNVANVTFNGCRFQSNDTAGPNVRVNFTGAGTATFNYCTVCPKVSLLTAPPNPAWPSAAAGVRVSGGAVTAYMIDGTKSYQYGIRCTDGALAVNNCDIWGFGNAIDLHVADGTNVTDTWIHDASHEVNGGASGDYHQDGPGYLDGSTAIANVTINHCTIASLGNTNGIAFQAATTAYSAMVVSNCYISGWGNTVDMCHNVSGNTGLTFSGNIIGTDICWRDNPIYANFTTQFASAANLWHNNTLRVLAGTVAAVGATTTFTSGDDGKYVLPDGSFNTTDFE